MSKFLNNTDNKLKLILFVLAFLLYANTIGHDYAWDDSIVITENPRVKKGIAGIPSLFLKFHSEYKADKYGYRPIVLSSFAIEFGLFKGKPGISHLMNVIYFALLCMVMFEVLRKLFYKLSNLAPFLITLLFIVHPIHVEAVANIKSRDEIFALLFGLLSLKQFIVFQQYKKLKPLIYSGLLFLLAFLSKENAITFLAILPLTFIYLENGIQFKNLLKPAAAVLALLILCVVLIKVLSAGELGKDFSKGAGIYFEGGLLGNSFFYSDFLSTKIANALTVLLLYLKNFIFPVNLVYYYGYNMVPVASWQNAFVWASLLINVALILFSILKFKKQPEISYGILFYFIGISVYTHLFITLADTMADRFLFMPSLGLLIAVVFALAVVFKLNLQSLSVEDFFSSKKSNSTLRYSFIFIALLLSLKTYTRNRVWKNDWTLTSSDMPQLENCARAHNYYADNLKKKLQTAYSEQTESEMTAHYLRSIAISKESYYSYIGLVTYYNSIGKFPQSIALMDSMLLIYPEQADPHYYLGDALFKTGEFAKAKIHLEKSLQLADAVLTTYYTLALTYSRLGEFDKALSTISIAQKKFSESASIYEALGTIYFDKKEMEQSTNSTLQMLRFGIDAQKVYGVVIGRYQSVKQDSLAKKYYEEALTKGLFRNGNR